MPQPTMPADILDATDSPHFAPVHNPLVSEAQPAPPEIEPPHLDDNMIPAVRAAVLANENSPPYQLTFAGVDDSGTSFGRMQGDLNAHQETVGEVLHAALLAYRNPEGAPLTAPYVEYLEGRLQGRQASNPLSALETGIANEALRQSSDLVDEMDEGIFADICEELDTCIYAADLGGRTIDEHALLDMAMWINMTGPPSLLLDWLASTDEIPGTEPPGDVVGAAAMERYLGARLFYTQHPGNFVHLRESEASGATLLPPDPGPQATEPVPH
jgi:hypothetical protein